MSTKMEDAVKRWTDKCKSALVLEIIQGKNGIGSESCLRPTTSDIQSWVDDAKRGMKNALTAHVVTPGRVLEPLLLWSDNRLVFTSRSYTALVRSYGLRQELIRPHCPQKNGMVERIIRTFKE